MDIPAETVAIDSPNPYYTLSTVKLVFLSVITLGIFNCVWFYKNWKVYEAKNKEGISPFWRSFFYNFTCFTFFGHVKSEFDLKNLEFKYNPTILGTIVFASGFLSRIRGPFFILCFLNIIPLVLINNKLIDYNKAVLGLPINDDRITILQWAIIIFGFTLLSFAVVGLLSTSGQN